ncbi:MAG: CHAD domain-containing protein [Thiobacillus sp.]|nr:CHAD domain-containing protein [Thiobacillus sp.]
MTPPNPVEIELKLALPPDQVAWFMKLIARRRCVPVQQNLMTRYYDTPDFALSAQGIALRVRKVGRRWLQTLKTEGERQGGLSRRAEYEMAVPNNKPDWSRFPAAAQALVPAALRAKLIPVFETQFTRTAWLVGSRGKAKIEVALDVGEVRAGKRRQPICEIELELKAGKPDALFVLAAGWARQLDCLPLDVSKAERGVRLARGDAAAPAKSAPIALRDDMRVEEGLAAIIQSCLAQFQSNLPGVLASADIEYVHQARVALRRLRATLHLMRRACVLPEALLEPLHAMVAALGPARDWDVLCCVTLPAIAPHDADEDAWQAGLSVLEARRAEVRSAMRAEILNARPGGWLLALQRWLMRQAWRDDFESRRRVQVLPLNKWARRKLRQGHQLITRKARAYKKLSPAERHALRIVIKRQRYAAEFFQDLLIVRYGARYQAALQDMQESSGRNNDFRVANQLLKQRGAELGSMGKFARAWLAQYRVGSDKTRLERQLKNFVK